MLKIQKTFKKAGPFLFLALTYRKQSKLLKQNTYQVLNNKKHIKLFSPDFTSGIKPVFYIIFLLFTVFFSKAQENLVPNGSFEEYWECPTANDLNDGQLEKAKYWWKPTLGSSDYFNRCNNGMVGVPDNFWGHQEPFHGDGYVGFCPNGWVKSTGQSTGYEYIQTKLSSALLPCTKYSFSMYVSCANFAQYGFGKIGVLLSIDSVFLNNTDALPFSPQIYWKGPPIIDTGNWVKLDGIFEASGGESFLTIGYFENSITNDTSFIQSFPTIDYAGYYYIDSISIIKLDDKSNNCTISLPNIFTPNGDGINDFYDISILKGINSFEFIILNRWGNIVFEHDNTKVLFWDGKNMQGKPYPEGVYYYIFRTQEYKQTGFIHLIR